MRCFNEQGKEVQISETEKEYYIEKAKELNPDINIENIVIQFVEDKVNIHEIPKVPFDRIRRITGYLTGNTNTWNDAKKDELKDRVLHK